MRTCARVCVCACAYVCTCVCVCARVHVFTCAPARAHGSVPASTCTHRRARERLPNCAASTGRPQPPRARGRAPSRLRRARQSPCRRRTRPGRGMTRGRCRPAVEGGGGRGAAGARAAVVSRGRRSCSQRAGRSGLQPQRGARGPQTAGRHAPRPAPSLPGTENHARGERRPRTASRAYRAAQGRATGRGRAAARGGAAARGRAAATRHTWRSPCSTPALCSSRMPRATSSAVAATRAGDAAGR
jgi:hypothetical protein